MRLHNVSTGIVASLLPLTTHKRHKVRIAAIQAITPIMHQVRCNRCSLHRRQGGVGWYIWWQYNLAWCMAPLMLPSNRAQRQTCGV